MGWWTLPGSTSEVIGDEAADAAAALLEPLLAAEPRPTLDELLDALQAALQRDTSLVSESVAGLQIEVGTTPRAQRPAADAWVALLLPGLCELRDCYQDNFKRVPSLRECLAAISFVLCSSPRDYVRDLQVDKLDQGLQAAPAR